MKKETISSQLSVANESLRVALENKARLETEVNTLNTTVENLNNIITKENLYVVVKEGTLGTAEEIQSINHTNGVMTCGTAELRFVTKLGKYRVEEIN